MPIIGYVDISILLAASVKPWIGEDLNLMMRWTPIHTVSVFNAPRAPLHRRADMSGLIDRSWRLPPEVSGSSETAAPGARRCDSGHPIKPKAPSGGARCIRPHHDTGSHKHTAFDRDDRHLEEFSRFSGSRNIR